MSEEDGFSKFEELVKAIKVKQQHIGDLERSFMSKDCPFREGECIGRECSWFMVCYWLNKQSFQDFLSGF